MVSKVCVLSAQLVLASSLFAAQWTGGGSNELFDPANWGGNPPDSTTDAQFWGGDPLSLVMSQDYAIKTMSVYGRTLTVDFQGKALTVGGNIATMRGAHVTFANGTVAETAGALRVGNEGTVGSYMTLTGSRFSMTVPSMLIGQSEGTSFSGLIVENGAHLTSNNGLPIANVTVNTSNNYVQVRGEGSRIYVPSGTVTIGHQGIGGNNWMEIRDQAQFECAKTVIGNYLKCPNNFLRVTDGGVYTNNGDFVISAVAGSDGNRLEVLNGGNLYVKDNFYLAGYAGNGSSDNNMVVSNASVTIGKQILLAGNDASKRNSIRIIDASLTLGGAFRFGWSSASEDNRVILCNGQVGTTGILVGKNDPAVTKDNRIVFTGTNDQWIVSGNDISLKSGAALEVDFPEEGRDPALTCLEGLAANLNLDGTMRIIVNAEKHAKKLAQTTTYPLVRVKNQIAASVLDHVTVDLPGHVTVALTDDKKGVDVTIKPYRIGFSVRVR